MRFTRPGAENTRGDAEKRRTKFSRRAEGSIKVWPSEPTPRVLPPHARGEREHVGVRLERRQALVLRGKARAHGRPVVVEEVRVLESHLVVRVPARSEEDPRGNLRKRARGEVDVRPH